MAIPTREELVDGDGLDEREVVKHFLGKTQEEARALIAQRGSLVWEDFMYMAAAGLDFYLPPALLYLESNESENDYDFASGLLSSLTLQVNRPLPAAVLFKARQIAAYIRRRHDKFGMELDRRVLKYLDVIERQSRASH